MAEAMAERAITAEEAEKMLALVRSATREQRPAKDFSQEAIRLAHTLAFVRGFLVACAAKGNVDHPEEAEP